MGTQLLQTEMWKNCVREYHLAADNLYYLIFKIYYPDRFLEHIHVEEILKLIHCELFACARVRSSFHKRRSLGHSVGSCSKRKKGKDAKSSKRKKPKPQHNTSHRESPPPPPPPPPPCPTTELSALNHALTPLWVSIVLKLYLLLSFLFYVFWTIFSSSIFVYICMLNF